MHTIEAGVRGGRALLPGVVAIALVTLLLHPFRGSVNTVVVALAYLSAVFLVAVRTEIWAAITCALLAFGTFDFFFIPPYDTFMDGQEFLRHYRVWSQTPVIVLSVQGEEGQKITALDLGADDFLTKPFGLGELLARIRATLRRVQTEADPAPIRRQIGDLDVDLGARLVTRGDTTVHLTPTEFDVLAYLIKHEGKVVTHRMLLTSVWGPEYVDQTPSLRVMITQLRKKVEADPSRPQIIVTEPGVGYRFRSQP